MKKIIITLCLTLLCFTASLAQKSVVWENPTTEFGTEYGDGIFFDAMDITRVELKKEETTVAIRFQHRSDYPNTYFMFSEETYLLADGVRYPVVSTDGVELGKWRKTEADGKLDMVFHFKPLPVGTKVFDFMEGDGDGAFQVKGIRPVEERHKMLFPSYWRNEKTGDWEIAFIGDHAIYDCKVWDMKVKSNRTNGEADIVLENGGKTVSVMVGKGKKGKRTITIDGKETLCSMITDRFVPYYPTKDTRTDFVDTNYKTDTTTIIGWIKDIPELRRAPRTFSFAINDFFLNKTVSFDAQLDSLGRFSIKIPLANSSEFFCDWGRCFVHTMFEPGKTYFLLCDFKEGRRMWMGDDVRLQNELLRHPLDWNFKQLAEDEGDFDKYIASVDGFLKTLYANIDELCKQHPTLSTRFNLYRKGCATWEQANTFVVARTWADNSQLPENAKKYVYDNFWMKLPKPYTLYGTLGRFLRHFLADAMHNGFDHVEFNSLDHIEEIATNQKELDTLSKIKKLLDEFRKEVDATPDAEKKKQMHDDFDAANADLFQQVSQILNSPHALNVTTSYVMFPRWQNQMNFLDSIGADKLIKSAWITPLVYGGLERDHKPLSANIMDSLKVWIDNPDLFATIEKMNNYNIALSNRQLDKLILSYDKDVQGVTEGEEILKKLLEPFKGKVVLIDVWGTWCGPCKEALSHSAEEYARLARYDMQFVYLANNSPQDALENVIKEYNVTGPNVTHFNLPRDQQEAVERYLQVTAFPTYKIVDKQGNILDIEMHSLDLNSLEELVRMMHEK